MVKFSNKTLHDWNKLAERELNEFDIEKNIKEWLKIWGTRNKTK